MTFEKRQVISYLINFLYGLWIVIIPSFNPYILVSKLYECMIFLFYFLLTVNLIFTLIWIYLVIRKDKFDLPRDKCLENNYFNFVCIFCDYYKECKRENHEKR